MTAPQRRLIAHAAVTIATMLLVVPALTRWLGGPAGFLTSLILYWTCFCFPTVLIHLRQPPARLTTPLIARRDLWILVLLAMLTSAVFIIGLLPHLRDIRLTSFAMAAAMALVNAPLEEAAWRGAFLRVFAERGQLGFWSGLVLFTAWHAPLALAHGVEYEGGWPMLIGGAAALGLVWSVAVWRTGSIFWAVLSHFAVNAMMFAVLVETNALA